MATNLCFPQFSPQALQSRRKLSPSFDLKFNGTAHKAQCTTDFFKWRFLFFFHNCDCFLVMMCGSVGNRVVSCSNSSNGNGRGGPKDNSVKEVEKLLQEKRRAELSARIASGEFTAGKSRYVMSCRVLTPCFICCTLSIRTKD